MESSTQNLEILLLAAVAAFLVFKLRGVLGRRDAGHHPPVSKKTTVKHQGESLQKKPKTIKVEEEDYPLSLDARLQKIRKVDDAFDEKDFLSRARTAFEIIVVAFSKGDSATLKPLLGKKLYQTFLTNIGGKKQQETKIKRIKEVTITDVILQKNLVRLTIRFISEQVQASKKQVTSHDVEERVDIWSFERKLTSVSPNWLLVKTEAA